MVLPKPLGKRSLSKELQISFITKPYRFGYRQNNRIDPDRKPIRRRNLGSSAHGCCLGAEKIA